MPEGDTVARTARRLHAALAGQPLTTAELRWGERDVSGLTGLETLEVVSRGKHILHRIEDGWTLHSHLKMEGSWHVMEPAAYTPGTAARRDIRAVMGSREWVAVGFRLGVAEVIRTEAESDVVGHLGPDVLGPDWDENQAVANVRAAGTTLGAALLDQRNLAGVGTMYASESLFLERVNPWARTADLDDATVRRVVGRAFRLLNANVEHAVQSTTGSRRRGETVYVHARSGLPCRRCGTTLRVAMIGPALRERTMFSCLTCQPGDRPTDDGRPQRPLGTTPRSTRTKTYRARH